MKSSSSRKLIARWSVILSLVGLALFAGAPFVLDCVTMPVFYFCSGLIAEVFALIFGVVGWRHPTGRIGTIISSILLILALCVVVLALVVLVFAG